MTVPAGAPDLAALAERLAGHGLALRSGFNFAAHEEAPAKAVLLVGNVGAGYWPHFQRWLDRQPQAPADPLDTWSRAVIGAAAETVGARAVSPSGKPFWPFQQWAMRAEGLKPSPLGLLMHPTFGLWHAFRGALLFSYPLALPEAIAQPHLCDTCEDKPCLRACPVEAYTGNSFAYDACLAHVRSESAGGDAFPHSVAARAAPPLPPEEGEEGRELIPAWAFLSLRRGERWTAERGTERGNHLPAASNSQAVLSPCRTAGCRDRNACPFGAAYRYPPAVQAFHMAAFARL